MRAINSRFLSRAALSASSVVLVVWLLVWAGGRALELAGFPLSQAEAERARERENERRRTFQRVEKRHETVDAVIAGRMSLTEAAAIFRELNQQSPAFNEGLFRRCYPGDFDEERTCRQVIAFVRSEREHYPGVEDEVVRYLEAELRTCLMRGKLQLPELGKGTGGRLETQGDGE